VTAPLHEVERLVRIETKLDMLVESTKERADASTKRDDDHEARLRLLESFKWRAVGAAAVISAPVGAVVGVLARTIGA
jgi:hypothetical protein